MLGLPTCQELDIVRRIDAVDASTPVDVIKEFDEVFTGLGEMPGEHHIVVDDTTPPVIHPPRRVPIAIEEKLKKTRAEQDETYKQWAEEKSRGLVPNYIGKYGEQ